MCTKKLSQQLVSPCASRHLDSEVLDSGGGGVARLHTPQVLQKPRNANHQHPRLSPKRCVKKEETTHVQVIGATKAQNDRDE